jgi:predicted NUDIX family NTP pyrophosphohydrolase
VKQSAGILLYKTERRTLHVLLAHPGGPFWSKKDDGVWSIPKGEFTDEDPLEAAKREFFEETGFPVEGLCFALTPIKQKGGKIVHAWYAEGDLDPVRIKSNVFEMEWPPRSGKKQQFPEIDRVEWFSPEKALIKILPAQRPLILELEIVLKQKGRL